MLLGILAGLIGIVFMVTCTIASIPILDKPRKKSRKRLNERYSYKALVIAILSFTCIMTVSIWKNRIMYYETNVQRYEVLKIETDESSINRHKIFYMDNDGKIRTITPEERHEEVKFIINITEPSPYINVRTNSIRHRTNPILEDILFGPRIEISTYVVYIPSANYIKP